MNNTTSDMGEEIISKLKELNEQLDLLLGSFKELKNGGKKFSDSSNS